MLAGCAEQKKPTSSTPEVYSNTAVDEIFDTVYSYKEFTNDRDTAKKHFDSSVEILKHCNDLFDIYNEYDVLNNLKTINDNAGIAPVKTDPIIIQMLERAKDFYDYSNGEFDITSGSLLKVWHNYREEGITLNENGEKGKLPTQEELTEAASHKGWDSIEIDKENNTVFIKDPNIALDVGGIAKGFSAELAAKKLEEEGMESGFLNVGRNIRLVGMKNGDENWTTGIADPDGLLPNGIVSIELDHPLSVVTSGDYERYYIAEDGNKYSHIIDPITMQPARYYRSVSIFTEDSGDADCLSTALFTMSLEEGKQLLKTYEEKNGQKADAIWIMDQDKSQGQDGKKIANYVITWTNGLEGKLTWALS